MKNVRAILLLVLLICTCVELKAARNTRLFNSKDVVTSSYGGFSLDGDGYMWIGTQYGLLRFDGTNFNKYRYDENSESSLSDNRVRKIMRDSENRMWVATCEGLNLYDPYSDDFYRLTLPGENLLGYISDIYQQSNGKIVFMVAGVGLYVIDFSSERPVPVRYMPHIDVLSVNTLTESLKGELVCGTHYGELIVISQNGQARKIKVADTSVETLVSDNNGNIFVTTTSKAWLCDLENDRIQEVDICDVRNPVFECVGLTKDGDILVGTLGDGVFIMKRGSTELMPYRDFNNAIIDLDQSRISTVYEDSLGNLWFGCNHQGVIMVPVSNILFNFISLDRATPQYVGGTTKVAVLPGADGIYAGLEDGRLFRVDEYGHVTVVHKFDAKISSMIASRSGRLYVGVDDNGLYEFSPATGAVRQLIVHRGNYMACALTEDADGNVYLGIHGEGVVRLNPSTMEKSWLRGADPASDPRWISSLFSDSHGRIWVGMFGGFSVYDPATGTYTSVSAKNPIMVKGVHNSIAEDPVGNIWVATSNGLYIINPDNYSYRRLTPKEGLCDSYVSTIVFDSDGDAWVGTHEGISRVDANLCVTSFYGKNDAADRDYFSATPATDGKRLMFSGENGITIIEPELLKKASFERDISISDIYLNGKRVNYTSVTSSGNKILPDRDREHINMSYRDNSLVLFLSDRNFSETDNLIYQWRIDGIIDDWVANSAGSGVIALPHLEPGEYVLEIRTLENGNISPAKDVHISVEYPWYLTPVAKAGYIVLILVMIVLIWRVIKQKSYDRINEEKIKFFINISHEIRSPLTLILGPLERIMKKENDEETIKNLNTIHRNANRILALINQLLDIRKIDKGKMQIQCAETEFISFTKELIEILKPQAEEKNIKLDFKTADEEPAPLYVWIDRNNFDKVLVNLISNAIKYTPDGGEIMVEVARGSDAVMGDYAEVSVTDTGIGLDEKNIHRLFDRFYQGKFNNGTVPLGFGIGLDLCKMLVELHHGTIVAANRTDVKGSRFTVHIPLQYKYVADLDAEAEEAAAGLLLERNRSRERNLRLSGDVVNPPYGKLLNKRNVSRKHPVKILVVDDDPEIRSYLGDVLSGTGKVYEAMDGESAMKIVMDVHPDLIITDVVMSPMDGLQLLKALKSNVSTNHIPVILLSSKNDVADRMAGWDKGADGYIGKPFDINELLSLVDNLIDNRLRLRGKFSGVQEQDGKIETPVMKGNDAALIEKIVQEINGHLEDPNLNVEKLCQEVGLSRAHLNRKMKELFGLTPGEFIRNIRLRKACDLLKQGDIDISQIAYSVGFTSQPHFSTAFKRFTGFSPSEYRTNNSASPE